VQSHGQRRRSLLLYVNVWLHLVSANKVIYNLATFSIYCYEHELPPIYPRNPKPEAYFGACLKQKESLMRPLNFTDSAVRLRRPNVVYPAKQPHHPVI
jgi:hypothetical protein